MGRDPDEDVRRLAGPSLAAGDPTGWFDQLYTAAADGAIVPWDRGGPNPLLVEWAVGSGLDGWGRRAVVVGCGYGDDAEFLSQRGFTTTAFDIAPNAVRLAAERFPHSSVRWRTADLRDLPLSLVGSFDLVFESMTVQSMPEALHHSAIAAVGSLVAPGGRLLVVAAGREVDDAAEGPPWPLTEREIYRFAADGLQAETVEDHRDEHRPGYRRWRAVFTHPGTG